MSCRSKFRLFGVDGGGETIRFDSGPEFTPEVSPDLLLFADERLARWHIDPIKDGPDLAAHMRADGLLVDTCDKGLGMGLLDCDKLRDVEEFISKWHDRGRETWVGGSITRNELPGLWAAGVDAVCVRRAACEPGTGPGRFGQISAALVRELVATIPSGGECEPISVTEKRPAESLEPPIY